MMEEASQLIFQRMLPLWVLALVLAPAVLVLVFLAYRRPKRDRLSRRILAVLRILLLATGILLMLGPSLRRIRTTTEPAPLALLFDDSASLQRRDALAPDVLESLKKEGLTSEDEPARLDLLKALLASPWLATLSERYVLQAYRFSDRLSPTPPDGSGLSGKGTATALGNALLGILSENRGRRLPEIVVLTDGRNNLGPSPGDAAARLASEGVQVHVVAFGDPRPAPDISLERIQSPDVVLAGDEAFFLLRVRSTGEGIPDRVAVRLRDEGGRILDEVASETSSGEAGSQVALSTRLERPGERRLTAEVEPLEGETSRDNNRLELPLEVKAIKIRTLYVDGYPRWEYRFLKDRLIRADDIEARCWLASASRGFIQESSPDVTPLRRVPTSVDDLLQDFDVVILGDVDISTIDPDPLAGTRFLEAVAEFVHRGGGLLMCAGPRYNPSSYRGTPLEPLLPVVLGREPPYQGTSFRPVPADPEAPHPVTILGRSRKESREIWESLLAPLYWYFPVEHLRPGAQTWLIHPTDTNQYGPRIVAAGQFVPDGWVGWLGTDETWRWRFPYHERYVELFWRGMLRYLAAARLRGDRGRTRLDLDRTRIELGEALTVEARLRDAAYQPVEKEEGIDVFLEGVEKPIPLPPVPGEPGLYRGRLRPAVQGPGLLFLTEDGTSEGTRSATARFTVALPSLENHDPSQDPEMLDLLARRTGGIVVGVDQAGKLLQRLDGRERLTRTLASRDVPLDGTGLLAFFLLLACGEWILRKRVNLS